MPSSFYRKMRYPRGGTALSDRIHRTKTHVIPFTDHSGREALMVFDGWVSCPLPQLFSFAIYFTQMTLETVKPVELLKAIKRGSPLGSSNAIRLELYFLPTSDVDSSADDDCIAHYRKEKAARGDYTRQIKHVEETAQEDYTRQIQDLKDSASDDDIEEQQQSRASVPGNGQTRQLPGLVPSYIDSPTFDYYHGTIFRYPGVDWPTDKRLTRRIDFDRISEEEYARVTEGNDEFHRIPPIYVDSMPFQESDTTEPGERFVGMAMFNASHGKTENETNHPWSEALDRAWKSW
jgi:hypothetical protein